MSVICHCNNCRSATGQIPTIGLITETQTVRVSLASRDNETPVEGPLATDRGEYAPAGKVFDSENLDALKATFLAHYKSSPARNRWFCGRCGTPIGYSIDAGVIPEEWGWPKMLDIWLGTVDRYAIRRADPGGNGTAEADTPRGSRSDLEHDFMKPERALWCAKAVPWVAAMARSGNGGIPEHPLTKINKVVGDDITADLAELNAIKTKVGGDEV